MNKGFTLIELVVVISIVAVLVATAVPRFLQWQREARIGHLNGVRGAVHSGAMIVHAALLSRNGVPDAAPCPAGGGIADNRLVGDGTICTEQGLVRTMHGYPASAPLALGLAGIVAAAGLGSTSNPGAAELRAEGYAVSVDGAVTTIARADAPTPAQCSFTYTEPLGARTAATISPSVISGC